jgi:hypothetical protein
MASSRQPSVVTIRSSIQAMRSCADTGGAVGVRSHSTRLGGTRARDIGTLWTAYFVDGPVVAARRRGALAPEARVVLRRKSSAACAVAELAGATCYSAPCHC